MSALERAVGCLYCDEQTYSCDACTVEHVAKMAILARKDMPDLDKDDDKDDPGDTRIRRACRLAYAGARRYMARMKADTAVDVEMEDR